MMMRLGLPLFLMGIVICSASNAVAFDEMLEVTSRTLNSNEFLRGMRMPEVL